MGFHHDGQAVIQDAQQPVLVCRPGEAIFVCVEVHRRQVVVHEHAECVLDTVADARFCKPLDHELLVQHAKRFKLLVTIEEHQRAGGFGSAVLEALSREPGTTARVRCLGIPDRYVDHMTSRDEQLVSVGLAPADLVRAVEHGLTSARV